MSVKDVLELSIGLVLFGAIVACGWYMRKDITEEEWAIEKQRYDEKFKDVMSA